MEISPHHSDDQDDMGGLHRDLAATGAVMNRRGMLRLAATFGVGAGMLQMLGCGSSTPTSPTTPDRCPPTVARSRGLGFGMGIRDGDSGSGLGIGIRDRDRD